MDGNLKLKHEIETCAALTLAAIAILLEVIDSGGTPPEDMRHAVRVLGLLQDRLVEANALSDGVLIRLVV